ncbi:SDR family NAD(P)-dependent oxidoreductase [Bordetella petrii]|uniref:SDR family NAD(P)-dependent oxidoreductase n=1 Tax=Bordetella petrii TaxID=94624 RepID=UPI001A95CEB6|nr:glucose 1-dehydrogenase [Bordetella petrii]MBO1112261.1 glucose 1-dehydrogenase [Bordetella petrii]
MTTPDPSTSPFDLAGKTALVTGSNSGIGLEIARGLLRLGARVAIHGRDAARARQLAAQLGPQACWCAFDLADAAQREQGLAAARQSLGEIDILVNNAGARHRRPLADLSLDDIRQVFEVNLFGAIELCRAVLPAMCRSGFGRIVNVSSVSGHLSREGDFAYPISKQALEAMTRGLAVEYGRHGVTCNAVAPATIATEFNRELLSQEANQARIRARSPLMRCGEPSEVVGAVLFFASPAASYVNGQTLRVDGGYSVKF